LFVNSSFVYLQVAYYGEPSMAPEIFIKAYASATSEEYQLSEEAPKIDAKNPAGTKITLRIKVRTTLHVEETS